MSILKEFRCSKCNKLLGKIDGRAEIVCTRCKTLNHYVNPAEDLFRKEYLGEWVKPKPAEDAASCSECEQLWSDEGTLRCRMYYNAMIEDTKEKHCRDTTM